MMKLTLPIAKKLLQLRSGDKIQASKLRQRIFQELLTENILYKTGRTQGNVVLINSEQFDLFLQNHYSVANLEEYVDVLKREDFSRSELIKVSTDSKLFQRRSFKGFLVNTYEPVNIVLNQTGMLLQPMPGMFNFIYDYEKFIPDIHCTIVGVENPESFRYIEKQQQLFQNVKPLFISRYPQEQLADIIRWLKMIPNQYFHFGDFDFAGINIYMNEFKKYIPEKSTFFIPPDIEYLISTYGNYMRYDRQKLQVDPTDIPEQGLKELIKIIHRYKKGLDQEIFQSL